MPSNLASQTIPKTPTTTCYSGPHPHTASTARDRYTLTTVVTHRTAQDGQHRHRDASRRSFVASEGKQGNRPTDPRLTQRGRKAVKGKAQLPYFTGTQQSKYRVTHSIQQDRDKAWQDRVLSSTGGSLFSGRAGEGDVLFKQGWLHL